MRPAVLLAFILLGQACPPGEAGPEPEAPQPTAASPGPAAPWAADLALVADASALHAHRFAAVLRFADAPPEAVPDLAALLDDDGARYYAVRALGELGHPSADAALAEVLADRDWGPRRYAALALGQVGSADPETGRALEAALDDVRQVRDDALLALSRLDPVAGGPPLERFWTQGLSTGLELAVTPSGTALDPASPLRLAVTLTNRTDHPLILPPRSVVLSRGLYLVDADGRVVHPLPFGEGHRRPATIDETRLEPGAAVEASLPLTLERWDRGVPIDHEWRPAPDRWAISLGSVRYLVDPATGGELSVRVVWHPAFVAELVTLVPRRDAFWTGKAASEPLTLTLPPLEQP